MFRSLSLPGSVLNSFSASRSLSKPIFIDCFGFFEPLNPPQTSKINEKQKVVNDFLLFSRVVRNGKYSSKHAPKMIPESRQDSPTPLQDPPKMAPRRVQDAFSRSQSSAKRNPDALKTRQGCPRHPKTPQRRPQDLSKARFLIAWEAKKCNCSICFQIF